MYRQLPCCCENDSARAEADPPKAVRRRKGSGVAGKSAVTCSKADALRENPRSTVPYPSNVLGSARLLLGRGQYSRIKSVTITTQKCNNSALFCAAAGATIGAAEGQTSLSGEDSSGIQALSWKIKTIPETQPPGGSAASDKKGSD